jgi:hypothetical protein
MPECDGAKTRGRHYQWTTFKKAESVLNSWADGLGAELREKGHSELGGVLSLPPKTGENIRIDGVFTGISGLHVQQSFVH